MAQVITTAGEQLFAIKAQNNQPLDIDTFIFAYVPGQDSSATIDRNEGLPPVGQRVHQQIVQQRGRVNSNVVIYSTVLDSVTGPFEFNWVGLYSSVNNTLVAISKIPTVVKTVTVPGTAGNILNRNFGIEYSGIADLDGITVDPETWQLDYTARLNGMDELTRQLAADMNGRDWFIDNGFKVAPLPTPNNFKVTAGAGYVSGLRIAIEEEPTLIAASYPQFVYVNAWFDGTSEATWKGQTTFQITPAEQEDYTDETGKRHYLFKLATITAADTVIDHRSGRATSPHPGIKYLRPIPDIEQYAEGFYEGSKVGDGKFIYDPNRSWAEHNGGTVIAFGALNSWDGTKEHLADYLNWVGVGAGCFVKIFEYLLCTDFGMVEDGAFDNGIAYQKLREAHREAKVYWPATTGLGFATSIPFKTEEGAANIGSGIKKRTRIIGLGNHPLLEVYDHSSEVRGFTLVTKGDKNHIQNIGIYVKRRTNTSNYKINLRNIWSGSAFNTLIYTDAEIDQSVIKDIVSFHNHVRGTIDIDTQNDAEAPTGAATIERIWTYPQGSNLQNPPSLFGIRLGMTDSTQIRNCILNNCQNDILIDNRGGDLQRNWTLNLSNIHFESPMAEQPTRWSGGAPITQGTVILPTSLNSNGYCYIAENNGTTGASEPIWPKANTIGSEASVTDNGITWKPHFSKIAIRTQGNVEKATTVTVNDVQALDYWMIISDRGKNWDINNFRCLGFEPDYFYQRTNDMGVDTTLSLKNSYVGGNWRLQEGSTRTFETIENTTMSDGYRGLPTEITRTSVVKHGKEIVDSLPKVKNTLAGETIGICAIHMPNNAAADFEVSGVVRLTDTGGTARDFGRFELKGIAGRVFNGNPLVSLSPEVNVRTTDGSILTLDFSTSFVDNVLTLLLTPTTSRAASSIKVIVKKKKVDSDFKNVVLV